MTFNPNSTIYLCNVPIDNTYKNQLRFKTRNEQTQYFLSKVKATFTNYLTVRKTNADGSMVSSVKVDRNIDELYNCNYMFYQNANHGDRFFYAFIVKLIYINEGTTEIVFECDVWQTWFSDITIHDSFVIREHSETDKIGKNLIPEPFDYGVYDYIKLPVDTPLSKTSGTWGYLITSSEKIVGTDNSGGLKTGIYQGLHFYYTTDPILVDDFIEAQDKDYVVSVSLIPSFCVSSSTVEPETCRISVSQHPAEEIIEIDMSSFAFTFDGYIPKNNKIYSSPFVELVVSNHVDTVEYSFEDLTAGGGGITGASIISFTLYGDVSVNPSVMLVPDYYKGVNKNVDFSIKISNFPQCSTNTDSFKLWLAKNQFTPAIVGGSITANGIGVGMAFAGVAAGVVAPYAAAGVAVGAAISNAKLVANTINDYYKASKQPNIYTTGSSGTNNLLTAIKKNCFDFYIKHPKRDFIETIDNYFTMFGYQVNNVKSINIFSRPYYNYIETQNVNITGGIPDDDMVKIKKMFDSGVTFWNPNASLFNYNMDEQDNRPQ